MLKGKNIICISSIDWDFIWQGHQEIMSTLADNGNRVLFIENTGVRAPGVRDVGRIRGRIKNWFRGVNGIKQQSENLFVFSPIVLPFPYLRLGVWINFHLVFSILGKWIKIMNFSDPIIWIFLPTPLTVHLVKNLNRSAVVYYCIDNFRASSSAARKIEKSERELLKLADLVFVTSRELYKYCSSYNKRTYIFPFAVDFYKFEEARLKNSHGLLTEFKDINHPVIGYIGGVHKWIDFDLVKQAAQRYPEYSFVFVGPLQADISGLSEFKNVYFLGKRDHKHIPDFIKNFDLCVIPYLITDYTRNVYPTKMNEYLAMGKAVLSTNLPEVISFNAQNDNLIFVGKTKEEFLRSIPKAINSNSGEVIEKRILCAKRNSWPVRIEEMSSLAENFINQKGKDYGDWQESVVRFYRLSRRRMFKLAAPVIIVYYLLFYTPLVWFLASPLQISDSPKQGDCIVVFAGGVGESGKPGQSYEERVKYAVELYKEGYAEHLIFSSGYIYAFKEPLIMKVLAVSLGVPENNIILEDKAKNTYENAVFTDRILKQRGWDEIVLISSPYHMRRVSLVFSKNAKNLKVSYVPVENNLFYSRGPKNAWAGIFHKEINFEQVRAILHEYAGILYYWWKGYI